MKKAFKSLLLKKPQKDKREQHVLLGMVELYLKTGKPVGSNTLKESGFDSFSSATIRNYFAKLEAQGYLKQHHSSGGRIPTELAYKFYADAQMEAKLEGKERSQLEKAFAKETKEVALYLQECAEKLSELSGCAVFLSAPRFDQDFVLDVRLVALDETRLLCALMTDFGLVHTEILYTKLKKGQLEGVEAYFRSRITHQGKPDLSSEEEHLASDLYKEVMLRHIVGKTHFSTDDLYRTGFSKLLNYSDFNDAGALASGLSLFENQSQLRALLNECSHKGELSCWIGTELARFAAASEACSVIAVPYKIHQSPAGAIALLGPTRLPYKTLFDLLRTAGDIISDCLTESLYKFKITFRRSESATLAEKSHLLIEGK